jgi:hypothetical protein
VADFSDLYRNAFASLGRPLRRRDQTPEKEIRAAEKELDMRAPQALREFYRVAGRALDYVDKHDHLLPPTEWEARASKLIFMAENQAVELYATVGRSASDDDDPAAFRGVNDDPITWFKANKRCSVFLLVMLYWQAAYGKAMPHGGSAKVQPGLRRVLDRTWSFVGEVNRMRAYGKNGQALCFLKWEPEWRVFAGCQSEASLAGIADELGLQWDPR